MGGRGATEANGTLVQMAVAQSSSMSSVVDLFSEHSSFFLKSDFWRGFFLATQA